MKHFYRLLFLCAGSIVLLGWVIKHTEPTTRIGLRYIHQARQIERGSWRLGLIEGIDHPGHPLGIAAAHRLFDSDGPASWQSAALLFSFSCAVLLVIPIYLLALELFGENAAFLGCRAGDGQPVDWLQRRQCPERNLVLALVELRALGGRPVPARGTVPVATASGRFRRGWPI